MLFIFRLLGKFGDTYRLVFTSDLLWTITTMAVCLVCIQIELVESNANLIAYFFDWHYSMKKCFCILLFQMKPEINVAALLKLACLILSVVIPLLVICNALEELQTRFDRSDIFQECKWYRFPFKIRRSLPIMIACTQRFNCIKVFGNVSASRVKW